MRERVWNVREKESDVSERSENDEKRAVRSHHLRENQSFK